MQEILTEIWARATAVQTVPPPTAMAVLAVVALLLVAHTLTWRFVRLAITVSHEGGHGLAAVLTGRRLSGIRLHSDTSGLTVSRGRPSGPGMVIMLAAGYLAPAVAGVGAALLLVEGRALGLLWLLLAWLVLMLVQIRNAYGFVVVLVGGAAVAAASWFLPVVVQAMLAALITWILLFAAPKPLLELARQRRAGRTPGSDVDQLARLTRIPGAVWLGLFLVANLAGLAVGLTVLLPSLVELAVSALR